MDDDCRLREANGRPDVPCDEEKCIFWRAVGHLGDAVPDDVQSQGCAVRYYELLGDEGLAAWLLSVKERVEGGAESKDR